MTKGTASRRMVTAALAVFALASLGAAACGQAPRGQGASCGTDGDCQGGLRCLPFFVVDDGACKSIGDECLQPCAVDSDCSNLSTATGPGAGFTCLSSCPSTATSACEPAMATLDGG